MSTIPARPQCAMELPTPLAQAVSGGGYFIFDGSLIVSPATMKTPCPR